MARFTEETKLARFRLERWAQREEARKDDPSGGLVTILDPTSGASEDYRTLRTSLLYALVDSPPKALVITSPDTREGKSTTCANLGVVLAQADKNTLIVDCDLRRPAMHKIFELLNLRGIMDVLVGERDPQGVWREPLPGLKVIPAGIVPPNPAEVLGSRRFAMFLARVRQEFDYVLLDTPPLGLVSDPAILATQGDGVLLVLDARKTRKGAVRQSMRSLRAVGANVLGTVMNNAEVSTDKYYYGYSDE